MYDEVDITDWKHDEPIELGNAIAEAVRETQRLVLRPLPSKLKMTLRQYNILNGREHDAELEFTNRQFFTRKPTGGVQNVMEVEVQGYDNKGVKL